MDKEIRSFTPIECELRATRRGRTIEGYGIVFNKESKDLGGFTEIIEPGAVEGVLERSDVLALLNHDENRGVLARWTNGEGTMELTVDKVGVKYRFEAPDTVLGDEVLSGVRRGDIRTSSFAFSVDEMGQSWEQRSDGSHLRKITKFQNIYDMSPVYREAYADTTVAVRSLIEVSKKENTKESLKKIADLEEELRKIKSPSNSTDVNKRSEMEKERMRKETLKDGTVIVYEDWLSKGSQVFIEKEGALNPVPDGTLIVREREEIYISNVEMTVKDGIVTEIKSSSTSVTRKEPEDLTEYFKELRNKIKN
jgi:uncharacterized protein